jgi:hypothetical protein
MIAIRQLLLLLALIISGPVMAQSDSHDHHHGQAAALENLTLNDGEKWASDEPLRQGMNGIREAVSEAHHTIQAGGYEQADYRTLAETIDERIQFMFANCNLDPEPDGQLHIILAELMQATETLKTSDNPRQAMPTIVQALNAYNDTFQHPEWQGIGR